MFSVLEKKYIRILLLIVILLGFFLRTYNINWDQGFHLHPDERAIVMYTLPLELPNSISDFLSPQSPLNPHFFAYGNFPLYLLKLVSLLFIPLDPSFGEYTNINIVGRFISASIDTALILVLYFLALHLFRKNLIAITATFLYVVAVLPIQISHFYTVDTQLSFFSTLTLLGCILYYKSPSLKRALLLGLFLGLALVSKISAAILFLPIALSFSLHYLPSRFITKKNLSFKKNLQYLLICTAATLITFSLLQPYAIIDFQSFLQQTHEQSQMTKDPYVFPYTLQYVTKIKYIHELENIFFWGLGPVTAFLSGIGFSLFVYGTAKTKQFRAEKIIILSFLITTFLVVGNFAVGWIRYLLPLYPLLCLLAAIPLVSMYSFLLASTKDHPWRNTYVILFLLIVTAGVLIWPLSFMNIYTQPHTRVLATEWIRENIPPGSTIATEHWDDRLPLYYQDRYNFIELQIYNLPDNQSKWSEIYYLLSEADYIVLSSNRLYDPLARLSDCSKFRVCYPEAANYYRQLFNGSLGFEKVAEFTSYPKIPFTDIEIPDQGADESFTVYDHPRVLIFGRVTGNTR